MAKMTVLVADAPYGRERLYSALRFALAARFEGHSVNLFLLEDAVWAAKRGQEPASIQGLMDSRMPNCGDLLAELVRNQVIARCCGVCTKERGLTQDDLIDGVEIGSMTQLVNWVAESDKFVSF